MLRVSWFVCAAIIFAIAILAAMATANPLKPVPLANEPKPDLSEPHYLDALANVGTKKRPTEADYVRGFLKRTANPIVEAGAQ
jgi:hypothetical protein